jgi:signal-transduction protein with cAMP-binding, CBS, and nucleotidyltransferase domain
MASKKAMLEHLRNVPLFSSCSTKELEKISRAGDIITLPAGSVIIDQGQTGREAFVIIEGEATGRWWNREWVSALDTISTLGNLGAWKHHFP